MRIKTTETNIRCIDRTPGLLNIKEYENIIYSDKNSAEYKIEKWRPTESTSKQILSSMNAKSLMIN